MKFSLFRLLCLLVFFSAVAAPARAQGSAGTSLAGTVADTAGGVIPGVSVTATGEASHVPWTYSKNHQCSNSSVLAVPAAVAIGVPLYSNAAGVVPLVEVLHDKGMPIGTVLAFMMSVIALSLPKMTMPTLSASRFSAMPLMPPSNSTISPAWTLSRP